jgi:hypothetical protein
MSVCRKFIRRRFSTIDCSYRFLKTYLHALYDTSQPRQSSYLRGEGEERGRSILFFSFSDLWHNSYCWDKRQKENKNIVLPESAFKPLAVPLCDSVYMYTYDKGVCIYAHRNKSLMRFYAYNMNFTADYIIWRVSTIQCIEIWRRWALLNISEGNGK